MSYFVFRRKGIVNKGMLQYAKMGVLSGSWFCVYSIVMSCILLSDYKP